jgi:hypothetical protein
MRINSAKEQLSSPPRSGAKPVNQMPRCHRCGAETETGAAFCARCGSSLSPGPSPRPPSPDPAAGAAATSYPLLARANLLRMRGRWDEAASLCAEALRLDPKNASAHSLLGDIHENQGNLEEALHWYALALELHPGSEADIAKSARVQELLEARQRRAEWQAVIHRTGPAPGTAALVREAFLRVVLILGAAVCAIIFVTAVIVSASDRGRLPEENTAILPPRPPVRGLPQAPHTARELRIMNDLANLGKAANEHGQITDVLIEPRTEHALLRMAVYPRVLELPSLQEIRERIQRDAYVMAHAVHARDPNLSVIDVQVLGDTAFLGRPGGTDLLFTATLTRDNLAMDPDLRPPTLLDLEAFYAKTYQWIRGLGG